MNLKQKLFEIIEGDKVYKKIFSKSMKVMLTICILLGLVIVGAALYGLYQFKEHK